MKSRNILDGLCDSFGAAENRIYLQACLRRLAFGASGFADPLGDPLISFACFDCFCLFCEEQPDVVFDLINGNRPLDVQFCLVLFRCVAQWQDC